MSWADQDDVVDLEPQPRELSADDTTAGPVLQSCQPCGEDCVCGVQLKREGKKTALVWNALLSPDSQIWDR